MKLSKTHIILICVAIGAYFLFFRRGNGPSAPAGEDDLIFGGGGGAYYSTPGAGPVFAAANKSVRRTGSTYNPTTVKRVTGYTSNSQTSGGPAPAGAPSAPKRTATVKK